MYQWIQVEQQLAYMSPEFNANKSAQTTCNQGFSGILLHSNMLVFRCAVQVHKELNVIAYSCYQAMYVPLRALRCKVRVTQ